MKGEISQFQAYQNGVLLEEFLHVVELQFLLLEHVVGPLGGVAVDEEQQVREAAQEAVPGEEPRRGILDE